MDEYYRAIRLLPSWLAGPLGQLPAQTAAQIHELRFRTGCGVFVTLSGRQLPLQDLQECPLQLRECVLDQLQIEEIFRTLCGGAVHAHQTELAHGFLTTPSGCRVGVAGRYVDRDGQTVLQQVQGLNLRIARAVPVQLPDELLVQLKKHFIGMLLVGEPDSGKTTLLRCLNLLEQPTSGTIYFENWPGCSGEPAWWTSAARSFRRVIPRRCRRWICCPASLRNGLCRWHCARFRRRLFCWTSWARLPKLQRWNRAFTAGWTLLQASMPQA